MALFHVATWVDGDLVTFQDIDEVVFVVVQAVSGTWLHVHLARDPLVVLRMDLVALRRRAERGDKTVNIPTWLACWQCLAEDDNGLSIADVFHLVSTRWEDRCSSSGDFHCVRLAGRLTVWIICDAELGRGDEVHGVRRMLMRLVLPAREHLHLDQPGIRHLGHHHVRLWVGRAAIRKARGECEDGGCCCGRCCGGRWCGGERFVDFFFVVCCQRRQRRLEVVRRGRRESGRDTGGSASTHGTKETALGQCSALFFRVPASDE
mmetsp:Transcript_8485/g.21869  ORF Transcript_8485/g.21869 Transcript_8485/m.21869 type:complete len:263 (-) Transcript_8485:5-793(-)